VEFFLSQKDRNLNDFTVPVSSKKQETLVQAPELWAGKDFGVVKT
jgi:hypothetical protein